MRKLLLASAALVAATLVSPAQAAPIRDAAVQDRLTAAVLAELRRHDATPEFYRWMGLDGGAGATA